MADKDFDAWNTKKKEVHATEHGPDFYYHEREVWWCALGLNVGVEADGKHQLFERPVVIIKKINRHMFLGVPLTTQHQDYYWYFALNYTQRPSWAILTQLRALSVKRLLRKEGAINNSQHERMKYRIIHLLLISGSPHLDDEETRGGRSP